MPIKNKNNTNTKRLYTMEYLSIKRKEVLGRKSNMNEYKYCAANCVIV